MCSLQALTRNVFAAFCLQVPYQGFNIGLLEISACELCGFWLFFSTKITICLLQFLLEHQRVTCCKTCSCARDCHMTGSCCPDAEFNHPKPISCLSIVRYLNHNRNLAHVPSAIFKTQVPESFRIVNRCPAGYNDVHVSQLCENPKELDDYLIVSDVTGDILFGNKHCAICHGARESVRWELFAYDCDSLFQRRVNFTSFEDRDNFVMKKLQTYCSAEGRPNTAVFAPTDIFAK